MAACIARCETDRCFWSNCVWLISAMFLVILLILFSFSRSLTSFITFFLISSRCFLALKGSRSPRGMDSFIIKLKQEVNFYMC
ncbi:unnamed protein product [Moneuplotes crassus]|uniref:Uncharacterized protein n=1 Tax=Euplotes crassus TaxID=5936 RepID=A0AAD1Y342_EUPCR|nr:unnamed protein product [Moneuplotes crassus]